MTKIFIFLITLTVAMTISVNAQNIPNYLPKDGLVGWWPFNGNANDESGNGNHGIVNGATLTQDRNGKTDSAYSFNGLNNFISFNNNTNFQIVKDITISCWHKSIDHLNNQQQLVWFGDSQNASDPFSLSLNNNNNYYFRRDVLDGNYSNIINSIQKPTDIFIHILGVFDSGTNKMKIYINGKVSDSSLIQGPINYDLNGMYLNFGAVNNGNDQFLKGSLDDIAIYNRALSPVEIMALYTETPLKSTTGVHANEITNLNVYPNPTTDLLIIDAADVLVLEGYKYRILDLQGKEVYNSPITKSKTEINLKSLGAKGVYVLHILDTQNNSIEEKKIVLE